MGHFFNAKSFLLFGLTLFSALVLIKGDAYIEFSCKKSFGESLPKFPPAFSSDVRLNFATQVKTVELRHYKDTEGKRESLEIFAPGRHVKYIVHGDQHLLIKYFDDDFPSCSVKSSSAIVLEDEDSGDNGILKKLLDATNKPSNFYYTDPVKDVVNGVFIKKWETCLKDPKINVSLSFSEIDWKNPGKGTKNQRIPVMMEAQIDNDFVIGIIDNFQSSMPDDIYFQPPADVFCSGFREDQKPPEIPNYFSYDSETIMFEHENEVPFFVAHRSVYYDYPALITRVDYHDPSNPLQDGKSTLEAKGVSIIHDYNSRIEYSFNLPSHKCNVEEYETTDDVVAIKETKDSPMLTGKEYFDLHVKKISYNGKFTTRGYVADVYTAEVPHLDESEGKSIYSWYFSSVQTRIVDNDKLDNNVLLRLVVHPETGTKRTDRIEMNFYNFEKQEPTAQIYDISSCYNESLSKLFVITFPANNVLRGSENFLKSAVHLALKELTGLSKQRIFVSEVAFNSQYMFAEFKLLEAPSSLKAKAAKKELSLSEAAAKIKSAVKDGSFKLSVSTAAEGNQQEQEQVILIPLENGFNEFSGDRKVKDPNSYGQGSVIGLTIGMLLLGFVVGGVALNLVVSRKFGVSLFQRKSGMNNFNNPLNESAM